MMTREAPDRPASGLPSRTRSELAATMRVGDLVFYVRRSEDCRVAVLRLPHPLTDQEGERARAAAYARLGRLYDTGFNIDSHRQFCSRFVHEILGEACRESVGEISTLGALLARKR